MLSSISWNELATLSAALLAGGVITGLISGLLGVGGGGVIVPVLYEVFGVIGVDESVRMQLCVGTSLAIIVPTSIISYRAHMKKGAVLPEVLKRWRLPAVGGIVIGSLLAARMPGWALQVAFVLVIGGLGVKSLIGRNDIRISDTLPGPRIMAAYGALIGFASALVGVSGGGISTNILLLYGTSIHTAVATSAGIGIFIPLPGLIGYAVSGWSHMPELPPLSIGYISVLGFILMAPLAMVFAPVGAKFAHKLSRRQLELGFGSFMVLAALRFLYAIIWQ